MKKILILTILLGFFTFFSDQTVNAEENPTPSVLTETNSRTVRKVFTIQRNWSMREYNMDKTNGLRYRPFPKRIYKIIDGYVGYVTLREFYQGKSVYTATYVGTLQKRTGPSVPLHLDKEY